ncbi:response regulator [Flavobacterium sp. W22_SRS_FK3]|uniref:response regulator n=1 Tax=Flavobacterium sp. W22_SRS_FK3 TaxID=3240275 RepID=UPI003F9241E4
MIMNTDFTIFYTDDDPEDLDFFTDALNELGNHLNIVTQNNGKKLLHDLKNPPPNPHIIFLDLNMHGLTGYDVLKELRSSEDHKNIPIIILSTSSDSVAIAKTRELGASYYIQKPTDFEFLQKAIDHVLKINWDTFKPNEHNFLYLNK